jgi:hypothetical protein
LVVETKTAYVFLLLLRIPRVDWVLVLAANYSLESHFFKKN